MKFFKTVFAVIVGLFIFSAISTMVVVFFGMIIISASEDQKVDVDDNTILHLQLFRPIDEREIEDPIAELLAGPGKEKSVGLVELRRALEHAKNDESVKGIFLEVPYLQSGVSSAMEARKMLTDFKESGKFIIAYGDIFTEGGYYVASVADEIYMAPVFSLLEFNGMNSEKIFFKGTLDKIGVEPVIFRAGKFKNAAESFVSSEMSETEKIQVEAYINSMYNNILSEISESRGIALEDLRYIADEMSVRNENDAVEYKLIDGLLYKDEVIKLIKEKIGIDPDKKIPFMPHSDYNKSFTDDYSSKNTVAVLIGKGNIVSGKGTLDNIASADFIDELRKLRDNDRVKAIVLRVNSPGGSALDSDLIWREVKLTAKEKPVIASMSDVAASGGYYISMAADTIVALPTTITGSIGVIGMYFNFNELLNDKLGITSDNYQTGRYSDFLNVTRPVKKEDVLIVQKMIDESYQAFVSKAAGDRTMEFEEMDEIAQGRVWTGEDAMAINLVDVSGDLEDAIKIASEKAGLGEDYKVKYYPRPKPFIEQIITELGASQEAKIVKENAPELAPYISTFLEMKERSGIQARIPYELNIEF